MVRVVRAGMKAATIRGKANLPQEGCRCRNSRGLYGRWRGFVNATAGPGGRGGRGRFLAWIQAHGRVLVGRAGRRSAPL